jgi:hypothetical protein
MLRGTTNNACWTADFLTEGKMSVGYFVSKGRRPAARAPLPQDSQDVDNFDVRSGKYLASGPDVGTSVALPPGYFDLQQIPLPVYPQKQRVNVT